MGRLLLVNLLWFFGLWGFLGWAAQRPPLVWIPLGLAACLYSLLWAPLVFHLFLESKGPFQQVGRDWVHFALRALALAVLSGLVYTLGFLNIRYYFGWEGDLKTLGWVLTGVTTWFLLFWTGSALYQWPLLFFQDAPLPKVIHRSILLFLANSWTVLFFLLLSAVSALLFTRLMLPWVLLGPVFFFSFQCVVLEKHLLRYRITYRDVPLGEVLERLEKEQKRTWREFFKPWEAR